MTIKTETRTVNIALRLYRGGWNAGYEPDCFDDMDNGSFAREFCKGREAGSDAILAADADLARGDEWALIIDEE